MERFCQKCGGSCQDCASYFYEGIITVTSSASAESCEMLHLFSTLVSKMGVDKNNWTRLNVTNWSLSPTLTQL